MGVLRVDVSGARRKLGEVVRGLKAAASGEVVKRAVEKVAQQVRSVAQSKLSKHEASGHAAGETVVDVEAALIQLHGMPAANGKRWSGKSYVSMHGWWPFRGGVMPPFVVTRATKIFEAELRAALTGAKSPLLLADEAAADAAEKKRQKAEEATKKLREREAARRERDRAKAERQGRAEARRRKPRAE